MQRRLRLISLSNYVFVLEISGISGNAQIVGMLIRLVMRNVRVALQKDMRPGSGS